MHRLGVLLVLLAAPLAGAAPATPVEAPAAPALDEPSPLPLAQAGDALVDAGKAGLAAASALGAGLASAASALGQGVVAFVGALGQALAWTAGLVGGALAFLGGLLVVLFDLLAGALAALGRGLSALGLAGASFARAHPVETAAAAGGTAGMGGLLWVLRRFGLLGLIPLYSRLAPGEMLENKARAAVYEHVRANPGAHPSAIAEALGLGWGTTVYHLARLEESKLVTPRSANNRKCYFAVGGDLDARERQALAAIGTQKAKLLVDAIRARPGVTQKELAEAVGMSQALASWHVKRLVASGVVVAQRAGRSNVLHVADHVPLARAPGGAPAGAALLAA